MSGTQEGYLLIADITGYTQYLSKSELEHAQETLAALLELLVDRTRPPLVISRLAGDAVISYGLRHNFFEGQTFVEMIEDTYVAFRKALERMVLNNTCRCNACANVSSLDLKFFCHFGAFGIQRIGDHAELVGSDVNLIHRLLKNHVAEKTGFRAYTLYTQAAIRQLGLEEFGETMAPHAETYEHLGEVNVWVQDMHAVWEGKRGAAQVQIPPEQILLRFEAEIAMPPLLVWDYLLQPEFRSTLIGSDRQEVVNRAGGRIAPGSVYQCYHGDKFVPQAILEWQPFERILTQDLLPVPFPNTYVLVEYRLLPAAGGTRLLQVFGKPKGPLLGRALMKIMQPMLAGQGQKDIEAFKQHIEKDMAENRGGLPPASPVSTDMITEAASTSLHTSLATDH